MNEKLCVVVICGEPGSGTSTTLQALRKDFRYEIRSNGAVMREWACKQFPHDPPSEALRQYQSLCEHGGVRIDKNLDEDTLLWIRLRNSRFDYAAVDGRIVGILCEREGIPVYRVLLLCDGNTRAERLAVREGLTKEEALHQSSKRTEGDLARYKKIYGIPPTDVFDPYNFDVTINTKTQSPARVAEIIDFGLKSLK